MKEIESKVSSSSSLQPNGLLDADYFVGMSDLKQGLQDIIDFVHNKKWRFKANVAKCAVVVFRNEKTLMVNAFSWTPLCHTSII